ncbi:MAG: hypothetical protein F8N36_14275 [Desulfovibrio sp.]|uniref:hypothetical protein n=1 Tax=Desulfovibrio sp. TaxID=885 RepID=UPI00135DE90F|nr:hypothetical protein [Desulfovibrio sp.]MTJ94005.1 hypothetical protein [Desulfovibrio sp.]
MRNWASFLTATVMLVATHASATTIKQAGEFDDVRGMADRLADAQMVTPAANVLPDIGAAAAKLTEMLSEADLPANSADNWSQLREIGKENAALGTIPSFVAVVSAEIALSQSIGINDVMVEESAVAAVYAAAEQMSSFGSSSPDQK